MRNVEVKIGVSPKRMLTKRKAKKSYTTSIKRLRITQKLTQECAVTRSKLVCEHSRVPYVC